MNTKERSQESKGLVGLKIRIYPDAGSDVYVSHVIKVPEVVAERLRYIQSLQNQHRQADTVEEIFRTADQMQNINCHKTALYLTGEISQEDFLNTSNANTETAGHRFIETHSESVAREDLLKVLAEKIEQKGFPIRISLCGSNNFSHTITLIGKVKVGGEEKIIAFDKKGPFVENPSAFFYFDTVVKILNNKALQKRLNWKVLIQK